jgi:hypothetical protein
VKTDFSGYEKVPYADLEAGDEVILIVKQGSVTHETTGTIQKFGITGAFSAEDVLVITAPNFFTPVEGGERTIYRKIPEFDFKAQKPGTLIEGTQRWSSGADRQYIKLSVGSWRSVSDGGMAYEDALQGNFKDWRVLYEGTAGR